MGGEDIPGGLVGENNYGLSEAFGQRRFNTGISTKFLWSFRFAPVICMTDKGAKSNAHAICNIIRVCVCVTC